MDQWRETISRLSPEKRAALESRLLKKNNVHRAPDVPAAARPNSPRPLSFAQQSLWFVDQLQPGSPAYNIPQALRLRGQLDVAALQKTFETILQRHEVLRTRFILVEGKPMQLVMEAKEFPLPVIDLSSLPASEREAESKRAIEFEARKPFDLSRDLMLRAKLLCCAPQEHLLLLTAHHIAADLWSFSLLYREMRILYENFRAKKSSPLAPLKIQYADFAVRQGERLQREISQNQLAYWKQQLAGELPVLKLPTARPQTSVTTSRSARRPISFPQNLSSALKQLSQREGVTLFMTLVAAFQTLLHRYSGQKDILIGSPIGGRAHVETEELIGYFVNTLVLRSDFSGEPNFRQLLQRVRHVVLGAFANQEMPLDKLIDVLRVPRDGCRNPLFNVMFQFQAVPLPPLDLPGLATELFPTEGSTVKFDLVLTLVGGENGFTGDLEFDTDLFDAADAQRLVQNFRTLLEGIVSNVEEKVSRLPLLSQAGREQLLIEWNRTETNYPKEFCIHELFAAQVQRTPEAVALVFGEEQLTYAELDGRADVLAAELQKLGVGPDVLVAICAERSMEMVVGLLGILKAGGAYVPLDAHYPQERLALMLADAHPLVLLTQKKLEKFLPPHSVKIIFLDERWEVQSPKPKVQNPENPRSTNLAYVIYTSGSTGRPKGVSIPHRGVVRLVKETNYAKFSCDDVFLQFAPISFDASTFEIWGSLLNGARLIIFPPHLPSLAELGETIREKKITTLWLTAGLFHQMVEHQLENLKGVQQLLAGGDVLSVPHVLNALQNLPDCQLINGYGPTENTTFTACYSIPKNWSGCSVPIGQPISNTQIFVLDPNLEPVPVGVFGELFIGGDGLAREYWHAPELTGKKFISHPFRHNPDEKLYRTGDLVRWRADGTLEFFGRIDQQVKIRGFRIELGEIEAVLAQHPRVRQAVVLAREDIPGDKKLVAYLVTDEKLANPTEEIRQFLKAKLPEHLLPSAVVLLDAFPLTSNGKSHRAALPRPESSGAELKETFVAAYSDLERRLQGIWQDVLGLESVGVRDNFFEIGGHSLLAVRLFAKMEKKLGKKLPLPLLFQAPTIQELAKIIRDDGWSAPVSSLIEIQPSGFRRPIFWLHNLGGGGGGGLFTYRKLAQLLGPEQPSYGLAAPAVPLTQIELMAAHYIEALRSIQPVGPYFLGGYCFGGVVAFEMARQLKAKGCKIGLLALLESAPPPSVAMPNRWSVAFVGQALSNIRLLLEDYSQRTPQEFFARLRRKTICLKKKASHLARALSQKRNGKTPAELLDEIVDMSNYPQDYRHFAQVHFEALLKYRPQFYSGRVTLFRTHKPSLFRWNMETLWSKVAADVNVKFIPGTHENFLEDPYVPVLAARLRECLEQTQPRDLRVHAA